MKITSHKKNKKLKLIKNWMTFFPCNKYYDSKDCIYEYISAEDMYNFIEGKRNAKK